MRNFVSTVTAANPLKWRGGVVGVRLQSGGFSMIEMLVVVVILAVVVTATIGVTGGLSASKGMTGVHQMAAACDLARARAMKEQREIMLAFANPSVGEGFHGRAVLICAAPMPGEADEVLTPEAELQRQRDSILEPLSEWIYLPDGHFFAGVAPAFQRAGENILNLPGTLRRVRLPGGGAATLSCLGFGGLGEVVLPEAPPANGSPLLIAISDKQQAENLSAQDCRWIGIQSHSGASMILP